MNICMHEQQGYLNITSPSDYSLLDTIFTYGDCICPYILHTLKHCTQLPFHMDNSDGKLLALNDNT